MADNKTPTPPAGGPLPAAKPVVNKMQVRSCHFGLSKDMDVFLKEITPAEACLLIAEHHKNCGGSPIRELKPCVRKEAIIHQDEKNPHHRPGHKPLMVNGVHTGSETKDTEYTEVERSVADEIRRLSGKYGQKRVKALYPGAIPTLPSTFDEAEKIGIETSIPEEKLSMGEVKL